MFEQSSLEEATVARGWSFAGSLVLQVIGLVGLILLPLLNTYEIDPTVWARRSFGLAVPPPPAPPPPRVRPAPKPVRVRYTADFRAPSAIPENVAVLFDSGELASPIAGMAAAQGPPGGLGIPGSAGVIGMFPTDGRTLPLPPPIRVGGQIQNARILSKVQPEYPEEALAAYVTGTVKLEAVIAVDGSVRDVKLISGHPMLTAAAIEAVSQWRYRPTKLNGQEVEVITLIDVNFNLTLIDEKEMKQQQRRGARQRRNAR
ncbi:MAG: energy transducer TonB [Bryobacterales bacterium]|nr:energy transducer TonB [Bryobacterales bacterium]